MSILIFDKFTFMYYILIVRILSGGLYTMEKNILTKKEILDIIKKLSFYDVVKETARNDHFGIVTIAQINYSTGELEFIHEEGKNTGVELFKIDADEGMEDLENLTADEKKALKLEDVTPEDIYTAYADDYTEFFNDFDYDEINEQLENIK